MIKPQHGPDQTPQSDSAACSLSLSLEAIVLPLGLSSPQSLDNSDIGFLAEPGCTIRSFTGTVRGMDPPPPPPCQIYPNTFLIKVFHYRNNREGFEEPGRLCHNSCSKTNSSLKAVGLQWPREHGNLKTQRQRSKKNQELA